MSSLRTARRLLASISLPRQRINGSSTCLPPLLSTAANGSIMTCYFSTAPHHSIKSDMFEMPPNLKIDPRVKSSPIYGAERAHEEKRKSAKVARSVDIRELRDDQAEPVSSIEGLHPDEASNDEYEEQNDLDEEKILYNLSTATKPTLSTPLPYRLHVNIVDLKTSEAIGTFHLSPKTFGLSPVRVDILHRVVVWQRNKKRGKRNAGARTKTISEVSGSGRKVRQQKGMGKARAGHSRPAHWRGGAKAHGPKGAVTDYTTKLNKKVRKLGVRHALSQKLLEQNLVILGDMNLETHKTRRLEEMLQRFGVGKYGNSSLFIDDAEDATVDRNDGGDKEKDGGGGMVYGGLNVNFKVASGNLPKIKVLNQLGCNVYDILKFEKLFLTLSAVRALEERLERGV